MPHSERPNGLRVIFVTRVTQGGRKAARPSFEDGVTMLLPGRFVNLLAIRNGMSSSAHVCTRLHTFGALPSDTDSGDAPWMWTRGTSRGSFARALVAIGAIGALAGGALTGCPGPTFVVQQYAGPVRSPDTVATLRFNGNDAVRLATLDDEDLRSPLDVDSRLHIELLPGRHRVGVMNANTPNDPVEAASFDAEPGKVYRVTLIASAAHVFEVNRSSDARGRDVTYVPSPAQTPTPAPTATPTPAPPP